MKTINCISFRENLLENIVERNAALLTPEMNQHKNNCSECLTLYNRINIQLENLESEKQTAINPYLINKILRKTYTQKSTIFHKISFAKNSVSFILIVVTSVLVGIGFNYLLYPIENDLVESNSTLLINIPNETLVEPITTPLVNNTNEILTNTENDILTLND